LGQLGQLKRVTTWNAPSRPFQINNFTNIGAILYGCPYAYEFIFLNIYKIKNDLIENLIKQVKDFYELIPSKKTQKWLQVGNRRLFQDIDPVKVEKNFSLAS